MAVRFEDGELGWATEMEENEKSLTKFGTNRKGAGITETTDSLLLEEKSKAGEIKHVEGRMGALMGDGAEPTTNGDKVPQPSNGATPARGPSPAPEATKTQTNGTPSTPAATESEKPDPYKAKLEKLKQRPTYTKEGKKRIAPLLVSGAGAGESSLPQALSLIHI